MDAVLLKLVVLLTVAELLPLNVVPLNGGIGPVKFTVTNEKVTAVSMIRRGLTWHTVASSSTIALRKSPKEGPGTQTGNDGPTLPVEDAKADALLVPEEENTDETPVLLDEEEKFADMLLTPDDDETKVAPVDEDELLTDDVLLTPEEENTNDAPVLEEDEFVALLMPEEENTMPAPVPEEEELAAAEALFTPEEDTNATPLLEEEE